MTYAYPINLSKLMDSAFLMALAEQVTVTSEVRIAMIYTQQSICCTAHTLYTHMCIPHTCVCQCPPYQTLAGTARGALPAGLPPSAAPHVLGEGTAPRAGICLHKDRSSSSFTNTHKATYIISKYCIETVRSMFEVTWQKINAAKE